jgi:hypothetical protein
VDELRQQERLADTLRRDEGQRRRSRTFAITDSSSGAPSIAATSPASVAGVAGSASIPPVTTSTGCSR